MKGSGPTCVLSMKTDSAVVLRHLDAQSVVVQTRAAAQKIAHLRELVF